MSDLLRLLSQSLPEIIGGLVVIAIVALLGWFGKLLSRRKKDRNSTVTGGRAPSVSPQQRLKDKLDILHGLSNCPFALVGSVYLDVILRPINTTKLGKDEWSSVGPIECALGGSSLWVSRYLWRLYKKKSYLFSIKGKGNDPFTKEFAKLIAHERHSWLRNRLISGPRNSRTAVTAHLVQPNDEFTTMFTHRGVLVGFGWSDIQKQLDKTLAPGGVLYLSGYMKTFLYNGLQANLEMLLHNTLICVDHGRLVPGRFTDAGQALRSAFRQGLVDVYFCTYKELLDLCRPSDERLPYPDDAKAALEELVGYGMLPIITVVRDNDFPGETKAYAIIEESVHPLKGKGGQSLLRDSVGPKNAFNAAMMYHLIRGAREDSLEELVIKAGKEALKSWYYARYFRWS